MNATLFGFHNSYARLPEHFFARLSPTPVSDPRLVRINEDLAVRLKLDPAFLGSPEGVQILAGNRVPGDAEPLAMAYAGFQFGGWVPQLGDGRAILLGELADRDGVRHDVQLKGCGRTPFSRNGDGRAALGPMLREYIISEAIHALNIPTTRSLTVVKTGETVMRETPLIGAILTRVAKSHIRVGTFQYAVISDDKKNLKTLFDYTVDRHYPHIKDSKTPALDLIKTVIEKQTKLVVDWMRVGFIHGVMNTDNMAISGETIDYGPCAFMDTYDPETVFSSIDQQGRYAYFNQPGIAKWNLARLAESLIPLIDNDKDKAIKIATETINSFAELYKKNWFEMMRNKLGLQGEDLKDEGLIIDLLTWMHQNKADYTNTFCYLMNEKIKEDKIYSNQGFISWKQQWQERLKLHNNSPEKSLKLMHSANPLVIPRNHKVEEALEAANNDDLNPMKNLLKVLEKPYENQKGISEYQSHAPASDKKYQTFCGT